MEVVLLERIEKLGQMGDVVNVKAGYARNFLLPQEKAMRATKASLAIFEGRKAQLEADNATRKTAAEKIAKVVGGFTVDLIRQASDGGQLYGSVASRDIASDLSEAAGVTVDRSCVRVDRAFKMLGLYQVKIILHPEVAVEITINIARSAEEAKMQKEKGSALSSTDGEDDLAAAAIKAMEAEDAAKAAEVAAAEAAAEEEAAEEDAA